VAFIARSLSYCALQTRRNTFLITITRFRRVISHISRIPHRARCDRASVRSILEAMIRKRATCSTSSMSSRDSRGFHALRIGVSTLCPRAPAWPFSPRTESIPVARGIYFGKFLLARVLAPM